jgi:hypothetical protein
MDSEFADATRASAPLEDEIPFEDYPETESNGSGRVSSYEVYPDFERCGPRWAARGFAVFPSVKFDDANRKRPRPCLVGGRKVDFRAFQAGTLPADVQREWFETNSYACVSALLGERSAGLIAVHVQATQDWLVDAATDAIEGELGAGVVREYQGIEWSVLHKCPYGVWRRTLFYRVDGVVQSRRLRSAAPHHVEIEVETTGSTTLAGTIQQMEVHWPAGEPTSVLDLTAVSSAAIDEALEAVAAIDAVRMRDAINASAKAAKNRPDPVRPFLIEDGGPARALGWNQLPQTRTGRRATPLIDKKPLKWRDFQKRHATDAEWSTWCEHAATQNVSIVMGETNARVFAVDGDCDDPELEAASSRMIEEVLGQTPLVRVGRAPRKMFFYRLVGDLSGVSLKPRVFRFAKSDDPDQDSGDAVEFLLDRVVTTAFGLHHKTMQEITWPRESPKTVGPEAATPVTMEKVEELIRRLAEIRPLFNSKPARAAFDITALPASAGDKILSVPRGGDWVMSKTSGLITDGREKFLTKLVFAIVRANPAAIYSAEDLDQLAKLAFDVFLTKVEITGRWTDEYIWRQAYSKVERNAAGIVDGTIKPDWRAIRAARAAKAGDTVTVEAKPEAEKPAQAPATLLERHGEEAGALAWLTPKPFEIGGNRKGLPVEMIEAAPAAVDALRVSRALRAEIDQKADWKRIKDAIEKVADDLVTAVRNKADGTKAVLVRAPTGSGKTTSLIKKIMAILRENPLPKGVFILFLVRAHENADDIARLVERDCAEAAANGCAAPGGVRRCGDPVIGCRDDARPAREIAGPVVGIWKGKSADLLESDTVCQRSIEYKAAIAAQMNASDMCEKKVKETPHNPSEHKIEQQRRDALRKAAIAAGKKPPRFKKNDKPKHPPLMCSFKKNGTCHFYNQKALFADASIIVASHYYSKKTVELPEALRDAAAVVIDEDPSLNMIRGRYVELAVLGNLPIVDASKQEVAAGVDTDLLNYRSQEAAKVARRALMAGDDPARILMELDASGAADLIREARAAKRGPVDPVQVLIDAKRTYAAEIAAEAIKNHRDPVSELEQLGNADDLVKAAKTVATRRLRSELTPTWTHDSVMEEAAKRKAANERFSLDREAQSYFWRVIEDRIAGLRAITDRVILTNLIAATADTGEFDHLRRELGHMHADACGAHDARLQLVVREPDDGKRTGLRQHVRVSWRSTPNFTSKPLVVLAAGGSKKVLDKIFSRDFVDEPIDAAIQMRIGTCVDSQFSNSAILPAHDDSKQAKSAKLRLVRKIRRAITKAAALHGRERILVVASKKVVEHINAGWWACPRNVEFGHYGGLAGLDFARDYPLIMTIGRSEMPTQENDALVGALTYDDEVPEVPYDKFGTGTTDGQPAKTDRSNILYRPEIWREQPMRSGETVKRKLRQMTGGWKQEVELIWREGEVVQAAGRVRPVYKHVGNAPTWLCLGAVLPENFIVDRLFALDDLVADAGIFDVQRLAHGVLLADSALWPSIVGMPSTSTFDDALNALSPSVREMFLRSCSTTLVNGEFHGLAAGWTENAMIGRECRSHGVPTPTAISRIKIADLPTRGLKRKLSFEERIDRERAIVLAAARGVELLMPVDEEEAAEEAVRGERRAQYYPQVGASEEMIACARDEVALAGLGVNLAEWDAKIAAFLKSPAPAAEAVEAEPVGEPIAVIENAPALVPTTIAIEDEDLEYLKPRWSWLRADPPPIYASG